MRQYAQLFIYIIQIMEDVIKPTSILKLTGLAITLYGCYFFKKKIHQKEAILQQAKKLPIISPQEAVNKKDGSYLVRAKQSKRNPLPPILALTEDIHYNQYYLNEPSDHRKILQVEFFLLPYLEKTLNTLAWEIEGTNGATQKIEGIGCVKKQALKIEHQYQGIEIGIIKKIWGFIAYYSSKFFSFFERPANQYQEDPLPRINYFSGPVVGKLKYFFFLNPQTYFVIKCKVENGKLFSEIIAKSKYQIIEHIQGEITLQKILYFLSGVTAGLLVFSIMKRIYRLISFRLNHPNAFKMKNPEEEACIICYNQTRNMIFLDCRHLILCQDCYEDMSSNSCPICKTNIREIKVLQCARYLGK